MESPLQGVADWLTNQKWRNRGETMDRKWEIKDPRWVWKEPADWIKVSSRIQSVTMHWNVDRFNLFDPTLSAPWNYLLLYQNFYSKSWILHLTVSLPKWVVVVTELILHVCRYVSQWMDESIIHQTHFLWVLMTFAHVDSFDTAHKQGAHALSTKKI